MLATYGSFAFAVAALAAIWIGMAGSGIPATPAQVPALFSAMWYHGAAAALAGLVAAGLRRRASCGMGVPRIVVAALTVAALGSLDRIVGVLFPPPADMASFFETHPTRGWTHQRSLRSGWGGVSVQINSHGLRDAEFPLRKPPGEFRILFLGDSNTFGYGIKRRDAYAHQTELTLNARPAGRPVRAINAGISGYSVWQELDYLKHEGIYFEPDLIVLGICFNDASDLIGFDPGEISTKAPEMFHSNARVHWSGLVRLLCGVHDQYRWGRDMQLVVQDRHRRELRELLDEPNSPGVEAAWTRLTGDLDGLNEFCTARDLPWIMLSTPFTNQFTRQVSEPSPQRRLQSWVDKNGAAYIDFEPILRRRLKDDDQTIKDYFLDQTHPNEAGHRLIADALAEFLTKRGLIK